MKEGKEEAGGLDCLLLHLFEFFKLTYLCHFVLTNAQS